MKHMFSDVNAFRTDPLELFKRLSSSTTSPLVRMRLGPSPVYLANDAELARNILKADAGQIDKGRLVQKLRTVIGESSITLSGEAHRKRRAVIHQHLAKGLMREFIPQICGLLRRQIVVLSREPQFDAHEVMAPLALRVIVSLLFGKDILSQGDEAALMEAVGIAENEMAETLFRILPRTPWRAIHQKKIVADSRSMMNFVVERVRHKATNGSLIKSLESLNLTTDQIRDEILLLMLAGHHTTGNAAAWILYFLAVTPGLSRALADEARSVFDEADEVDPIKLQKAETSLSVAREVLRLFPPFYWLSRELKADLELGGKKLRRGTSIIISPWQFQHDPRYFASPESFRMDRNYNTAAFMPFGIGARACVGIGLGLLELQLLALKVASACNVEILSEVPALNVMPRVTLMPPRISLRLKPLDQTYIISSLAS